MSVEQHLKLDGVGYLKIALGIGQRWSDACDINKCHLRIAKLGFVIDGINVFAVGAEKPGAHIDRIQNLTNATYERAFTALHGQ